MRLLLCFYFNAKILFDFYRNNAIIKLALRMFLGLKSEYGLINQKRKEAAMATILITGATGTVGSSLASSLESKGHRLIYLIRPKNGQNNAERLSEALGLGTIGSRVILEGDVTLDHLGVNGSERRRWRNKIDKIVNCAASIKFEESLRRLTTQINIEGVRNLLGLAEELRISEFHQISTAYVAGDADYFTEDDFDIGQKPRNVYEETKKEAERLVRNWRYGRYSIYRLGIVVGDSATGYISSFNGYYGFLSSLWHLRRELELKDRHDRKKYDANGISFDSDGMLILPICMNFSPISTLNITPIDWVVRTVSDLVEFPTIGQVFHIVHPQPPKARWMNDVSLKELGIKGFYYGDSVVSSAQAVSGRFQRIFNRSTAQYIPYITHEAKFEVANVPRVLGLRYASPPNIDEAFVPKVLDYAKSVDFGKKKKVKV